MFLGLHRHPRQFFWGDVGQFVSLVVTCILFLPKETRLGGLAGRSDGDISGKSLCPGTVVGRIAGKLTCQWSRLNSTSIGGRVSFGLVLLKDWFCGACALRANTEERPPELFFLFLILR